MKLEDIMQGLRDGRRYRSRSWSEWRYLYAPLEKSSDGYQYEWLVVSGIIRNQAYRMTIEDLFADDYEEYTETGGNQCETKQQSK